MRFGPQIERSGKYDFEGKKDPCGFYAPFLFMGSEKGGKIMTLKVQTEEETRTQ